jgi:hypothetical protein
VLGDGLMVGVSIYFSMTTDGLMVGVSTCFGMTNVCRGRHSNYM